MTTNDILNAWIKYSEYDPEQKRFNLLSSNYYMHNAHLMLTALRNLGYQAYGGENAPYIWTATPGGLSSWQFFELLLHKANIVCTPGAGFGPSGEGYVRFTAFNTRENTNKALERIRAV